MSREDNPSVQQDNPKAHRSGFARTTRVLAVPIILIWVLLAVVVTVFVPTLEDANKEHAGGLVPHLAPSTQAAIHQGEVFLESNASSTPIIIFEAHGRKLGNQDLAYYNELVRQLRADKEHVLSVQALWGEPVTRSGQQSADAQAALLTVHTIGDVATADANKALHSVREIVNGLKKPDGLSVHVSGVSSLSSDTLLAADESMGKLTIVTIILIIIMLLIVYRSFVTMLMPLVVVLIELAVARGVVSFMVMHGIIGISSFAMNMLVALTLGVGTDYSIFLLGRYHEARLSGEGKEEAYYTSVANVTHVILGSGAAISGASMCLSFTYLDYFKTLGPACAVGMVLAALGGLTLGPAFLTAGSKIGLLDPKKGKHKDSALWRRLGTAMVRWPVPLIVIGTVVAVACSTGWLVYTVNYNDRAFVPDSQDSASGYDAADRHFAYSHLSNDIFYVESDHDMRNTTDMITLDRISKAILRTPGISLVQSVTRPNGRASEHASLPYSMAQMGVKLGENVSFLRDRAADIGKMSDWMTKMVQTTEKMRDLTTRMAEGTHISLLASRDMLATISQVNDDMGYVDDYFRPFRNFFYWETYCWELPWCWAGRSLFDALDAFDKLADNTRSLSQGMAILDEVTPQLVTQIQSMANITKELQSLTLTMKSTMDSMIPQLEIMVPSLVDMGKAFDNSKNDDFFFLTQDSLKTHDFKIGMDFFMTPDGKGTRIIAYHQGEALSVEGVDQIERATFAAQEALKGTSISDAKIMVSGSAATYRDIKDFSFNDTILMMFATFVLVFLIVLLVTKSLAAGFIVTATVVLSYAGGFGLSVFIWQYIFHLDLYWLSLPISFLVLVAVGCDYNLLLLNRYREEIGGGVKTGLIRAMGTSGNVAVVASVVFAVTMFALTSSDVLNIGQAGSTIGFGLLLDMFVMRLLVVLPLAGLLGKWFWWPQKLSALQEESLAEHSAYEKILRAKRRAARS